MKNICYLLAACIVLSLLSCQISAEPPTDPFTTAVDQILQDWESDEPGGAVAVIEKGKVIYEKYFGLADLEKVTPFSPQTQTDIGSISKQFTACLIALLEEEGKLSIEDDIRKFIPELPIYEYTVRIKNLVHHSSGIRDYEALELLKGKHYFDEHMSNPYVVRLMARQRSLNFVPNSRFEYSNSNYILLAEIIERITHKSLNEVATSYIFEPLNMTNTFFHINQGEDFDNKAIGYTEINGELSRPKYQSHLIGDGGIYTTLHDLILWDQNFFSNQLGKGQSDLMERMKYREQLSDGQQNFMAFAQVFTSHSFGEQSWSHGGGGGGYRSFYIRFEEIPFSVIVLSNSDPHNAFQKANAIADQYFTVQPAKKETVIENESSPPKLHPIVPTDEAIEQFCGYYYDEDRFSFLHISYEAGRKSFRVSWLENKDDGYSCLVSNDSTLVEQEDSNYSYELNRQEQELVNKNKGVIERRWRKASLPILPIAQWSGTYHSTDIEHTIHLSVKDSTLVSNTPFVTELRYLGDGLFLDNPTFSIVKFLDKDKFTLHIPQGDRNLRHLEFNRTETKDLTKH